MRAFGADPPSLSPRPQELAEEPAALGWARSCAWIPGTGHCRRRDCGGDCVFHPQFQAETARVRRWRQLRRIFGRRG
jgi:hypothetical protein